MATEDGGAALFQQPGQVDADALLCGVGAAGQAAILLQRVLVQGAKEGHVTLLINVRAETAADVADPAVPQPEQLLDGGLHGLVVVDAHLGYLGVILGVIVQQHRGGAAGAELRRPGVAQGGTQEEAALILVAQHVFIIVVLLLQLDVQGDKIHHAAVRLRQLAEARHQIPAKVVGVLVGHVLDEHADSGRLPGAQLPGIAQLHRRLQYAAAHGLAHILCPAERLGHCSLGNSQPPGNVIHGSQKVSPRQSMSFPSL